MDFRKGQKTLEKITKLLQNTRQRLSQFEDLGKELEGIKFFFFDLTNISTKGSIKLQTNFDINLNLSKLNSTVEKLEKDLKYKHLNVESSFVHTTFDAQLRKRKFELPELETETRKRMKMEEEISDLSKKNLLGIDKINEEINSLIDSVLADLKKDHSLQIQFSKVKIDQAYLIKGTFSSFEIYISFSFSPSLEVPTMESVSIYGIKEQKAGIRQLTNINLYKKLSETFLTALNYFSQSESIPKKALLRFLLWLNSFHTLFQNECKGCKKLLFYDSVSFGYLPPTFHTYDLYHPYHPQCSS